MLMQIYIFMNFSCVAKEVKKTNIHNLILWQLF